MSSTQQSSKQTAQGTTMNENVASNDSAEADISIESPYVNIDADATTANPKERFQDSGFFEDLETTEYEYVGGKDWILFNDHVPHQDENYFLTEDDAIDIASTKANHGSTYNGSNNKNTLQIERGTSYNDTGNNGKRGETVYDPVHEAARSVVESDEGYGYNGRPQHQYSNFDDGQVGLSSLNRWITTFERHESIAYRFEQPPNPSHVFRQLQIWDEDFDLEDISQPYY
jgi:hypothetical protein